MDEATALTHALFICILYNINNVFSSATTRLVVDGAWLSASKYLIQVQD